MIGHSVKNLQPSQKSSSPWCPKLVTRLVLHLIAWNSFARVSNFLVFYCSCGSGRWLYS